jgi:hypothetical protein
MSHTAGTSGGKTETWILTVVMQRTTSTGFTGSFHDKANKENGAERLKADTKSFNAYKTVSQKRVYRERHEGRMKGSFGQLGEKGRFFCCELCKYARTFIQAGLMYGTGSGEFLFRWGEPEVGGWVVGKGGVCTSEQRRDRLCLKETSHDDNTCV